MKRILVCLLVFCFALSSLCAYAESDERVVDERLDNVSLTTGLYTEKPDIIVLSQFDNDPGARPQKGIGSADIVYEVEIYNKGYTRYTAVFNDTIPNEIEAIRSTRIVHIDIALEYNGLFLHYGAQKIAGNNAIEYADNSTLSMRIDGMHDGHFYRDTNRSVPNNVVCRLASLVEDNDFTGVEMRSPLTFSPTGYTVGTEAVDTFSINYRENYVPSYEFNHDTGLYYRSYNGKAYKDGKTGEQVTCSNVIVHYMTYDWLNGDSDVPVVTTTGTNRCDYFINGTHISGYWVRDDASQSTTYYDEDGNEVVFHPGKTYIQTLRDTENVIIGG